MPPSSISLSALVFPSCSVSVSGMGLTGRRLSKTGEDSWDNLKECARSLWIGVAACVLYSRTAVLGMNQVLSIPLGGSIQPQWFVSRFTQTTLLVSIAWVWGRISRWIQFWAVHPRINQKLPTLFFLGKLGVAFGFPNTIAVLLVHRLEKRFSEPPSVSNAPCHSDSETSSS